VDAGALEIGTLRAEIKGRQEELAYIGNLLDEYAKTFETRLGVGEAQRYGDAVESARLAVDNKALSLLERFNAQTTFVALSAQRLFDVAGGSRFPGVGVDTLGALLQGQFAVIGPVSLFRADSGAASGIAVPQPGSPNPLVRPLEGSLGSAVGALVATGQGTLPLDPSRGGALKALVQKTNLWHIFVKGGPIMWPLLLASIVAVAVVLERVLFLLGEQRRRDPRAVDAFFADVAKGNLGGAIALAGQSRDAIVTTLGYALARRDQSLSHALAYAETRTLKRYRRGIAVLDTVITLAPLLGLLGTVTGMMGSFSVIGGDLSSPGAITGGIAEALIATAFGLLIAIVCLLPFNYLNNRIEGVETEMLAAGEQLKLLMEEGRPDGGTTPGGSGRRQDPPAEPKPEPVLAGGG
jgi:biopolymer transport protein ExbB